MRQPITTAQELPFCCDTPCWRFACEGAGDVVADMRQPGESFCVDRPDHAGCMDGIPCSVVKAVHGGTA